MAVSSIEKDILANCAEDQTNIQVEISAVEETLGNYVDVRQRIKLPDDYCPISQIVKLKFAFPKISIVNIEDDVGPENGFQINKQLPQIYSSLLKTDQNGQSELVWKNENSVVSTEIFLENERQHYGSSYMSLKNRLQDEIKTESFEQQNEESRPRTVENFLKNEKYENKYSAPSGSSTVLAEDKLTDFRSICKAPIVSPGKVKTKIQAYNVLVENASAPDKTEVVIRRSIEDLTRNRLAFPDFTVRAKKIFFESALPQMREAPKKSQTRGTIATEAVELPIEEKVREFFESKEYTKINYRKLPFDVNSPNKSPYKTLRDYLIGLNNLSEDEDSKIVKELVIARFQNALQNFIEKSGKRRKNSTQESVQETSTFCRDSGNSSFCGENPGSSEYMFKSHELSSSTLCEDAKNTTYVISTDENDKNGDDGDLSDKSDKMETFDEKQFLNLALGSEVGDTSDLINGNSYQPPVESIGEISVGTSELSELVSSYDIYSTIDHKTKKNRQSMATYTSISSSREFVLGYSEPSTELTEIRAEKTLSSWKADRDKDKLMSEFHKQTCIVSQVSKALHLCQKRNDFYECIERVEAERVLLFATLRKQAIMEEMNKVDYKNIDEPKIGYIRLSDISIPLTCSSNNSIYTRFFVGIFRFGSTVFSSGLLSPNEDMKLEIKESFYFEELPAGFEITFQIYSMYAKIMDGHKNSSLSFKDCSQKVIKKIFSPKKKITHQIADDYTLKKPSFILYGKGSLNRTSMKQGEFQIHNVFPRIPIADSLKCNVDSLAKLTNKLSGFLTVGEHKMDIMMWNRQWCVLQATEIRFWDYPAQEENDEAPNRVIDLMRCTLQEITQADMKFCMRPRSLCLQISPESVNENSSADPIYLSADTQDDFTSWKNELNSVFTALQQWGCFREY